MVSLYWRTRQMADQTLPGVSEFFTLCKTGFLFGRGSKVIVWASVDTLNSSIPIIWETKQLNTCLWGFSGLSHQQPKCVRVLCWRLDWRKIVAEGNKNLVITLVALWASIEMLTVGEIIVPLLFCYRDTLLVAFLFFKYAYFDLSGCWHLTGLVYAVFGFPQVCFC